MIEIKHIQKSFPGGRTVHQDILLRIPAGQMTVILGRSGEGKSLLLKQLIGLIEPTRGEIIINGISLQHSPAAQRAAILQKCGYVFQFAALLDSLTILQNIGISLLETGQSETAILPAVKTVLQAVNLPATVLTKYPAELSGGMLKRVGLARTLLTQPELIFYDEPTSGLDPITTTIIHQLMADLQQKLQLTAVVVSHDMEIFKYADNVALLADGRIRWWGPAKTIWQADNPYIYQFLRGLTAGPLKS